MSQRAASASPVGRRSSSARRDHQEQRPGLLPGRRHADLQRHPANPVIFTSYSDDSAGGDTNANGPSTGSAAQWYGIGLQGPGANLTWTEVRFAGYGSYPGVGVNGSSPTLSRCTVRDCYGNGLQTDHVARPHVANCVFTGNGGTAIHNLHIEAVAGFTANAASGNGRNVLAVTNGTPTVAVLGPRGDGQRRHRVRRRHHRRRECADDRGRHRDQGHRPALPPGGGHTHLQRHRVRARGLHELQRRQCRWRHQRQRAERGWRVGNGTAWN